MEVSFASVLFALLAALLGYLYGYLRVSILSSPTNFEIVVRIRGLVIIHNTIINTLLFTMREEERAPSTTRGRSKRRRR